MEVQLESKTSPSKHKIFIECTKWTVVCIILFSFFMSMATLNRLDTLERSAHEAFNRYHRYQLIEMTSFIDLFTDIPVDPQFVSQFKQKRFAVIDVSSNHLDQRVRASIDFNSIRNEAFGIVSTHYPETAHQLSGVEDAQREKDMINLHLTTYNTHVIFMNHHIIARNLMAFYRFASKKFPDIFMTRHWMVEDLL